MPVKLADGVPRPLDASVLEHAELVPCGVAVDGVRAFRSGHKCAATVDGESAQPDGMVSGPGRMLVYRAGDEFAMHVDRMRPMDGHVHMGTVFTAWRAPGTVGGELRVVTDRGADAPCPGERVLACGEHTGYVPRGTAHRVTAITKGLRLSVVHAVYEPIRAAYHPPTTTDDAVPQVHDQDVLQDADREHAAWIALGRPHADAIKAWRRAFSKGKDHQEETAELCD
jgi:hypothetical protein